MTLSWRAALLLLLPLLSVQAGPALAAETPVLLWPNGAPGSEGKTAPETASVTPQGDHVVAGVHHPSITPYLPDPKIATGAAVIVIPGGGHSALWLDSEGYNVAQWMSDHGIAAFVLKYRLAREKGSTYTVEGDELNDTQRALRLVRARAADWHIDGARVGVVGFSAGGELAALAGTRYDTGKPGAPDPIDQQSARPSFMGLIYPAIPKEMPLTADTPPAFLACGEKDRTNISEGIPALYLDMKHAGVPVEMHVFSGVGHGFGIRPERPGTTSIWPLLFTNWLQYRGLLKPAAAASAKP